MRWCMVPLTALCAVSAITGSPRAYPAANDPALQPLRVPGPLSPRNASYRIRASLDEKTHRITGEAKLTWRNLERYPADRLVLHLYQNAFKNFASNFIIENGPNSRGAVMPEHGYGAIDVTKLRRGSVDLLPVAEVDDTLLTVPLQPAVGPSATVEIDLAWTVQLPRVFARSGWVGNYHAATQWFPKVGVWDCPPSTSAPTVTAASRAPARTDLPLRLEDGTVPTAATAPPPPTNPGCRWRAHQYHGQTEFFSDFGNYDVELDFPDGYVVGASGVRVGERRDNGRYIIHHLAEDVHDFAWFADRAFVEIKDSVRDDLGTIAVQLLTRKGQLDLTERHLTALRTVVEKTGSWLGPYPYQNISVVIPPGDGLGSAGMEYPTLFTSFTAPAPRWLHLPEETTIHEYLHQYFFHQVASDEVEDAWLDEGLTQAITAWVMEDLFGARCSLFDSPLACLSDRNIDWLTYRSTTGHAPITAAGFQNPHYNFGDLTYNHTAVVLHTLRNYLGRDKLQAGLRLYFERSRYRHPTKADFIAALSDGAGQDLHWFFKQALDMARDADYEILGLSSAPREAPQGLWDCPAPPTGKAQDVHEQSQAQRREVLLALGQAAACAGNRSGRVELGAATTTPKLYDSEVIVRRGGEFLFPVEVLAVFSDGSSERVTWSVAEQVKHSEIRAKHLWFPMRPGRLLYAEVDPDHRFELDQNRLNNGRSIDPAGRPVARLFLTLVGGLQTLLDLAAL